MRLTSRPAVPMQRVGSAGSSQVVYDDIQGGLGQLQRPGISDPTWRTYNLGIGGGPVFSVLGFALNQYVDIWVESFHSMKLSTVLCNHMHWIIPSDSVGDKIKFEIAVAYANIDESFAAAAGSPFSAEHVVDGTESTKHKYLDIGDIPAVNTEVSCVYAIQLKRVAASSDDFGPEVYMLFNDNHVSLDTGGSLQEDSKV